MKRLIALIAAVILFYPSQAQNIGIGITTPRAKLHVFNGASGNTTPYSPMVVESDANSYINLLSPEFNESGLLFGTPFDAASGGVVYNSLNTPRGLEFRTGGNNIRMVIANNGNVGIGTAFTTPLVKLHVFSGSSGSTVAYSPLAVESNANTSINLLSPETYETSIMFGKPSNAASGGIIYNGSLVPDGFQFRTGGNNTTRMLISNNGYVAIGIGQTQPQATFDVGRGVHLGGTAVFRGSTYWSFFNNGGNENTFIRAGKINGTVVLNDIDGGKVGIGTGTPTAKLGFSTELGKKITLYPSTPGDYGFGIQPGLLQIYSDNSNSDIGFGYDQGGGSLVEKFRFKGNGAFVVNGTAGSAGQVLQSNGNAASPTWTTPANPLYNNTAIVSNSIATLINSGGSIAIPFSHTFTTASNAKVLVTFSFQTRTVSCFACGITELFIDTYLDGGWFERFAEDIPNGVDNTFTGNALFTVGPGTHTISFTAHRFGPDAYVGNAGAGLTSHVIFQIIPQ